MRNHSDIIKPEMVDAVVAATGKSVHTVRSWRQRNSIPGQFWVTLSGMGLASLEELALAAAASPPAPRDEQAAA